MFQLTKAKFVLITITISLTLMSVSLLRSLLESKPAEKQLSAQESILAKNTAEMTFKSLTSDAKFKIVDTQTTFQYKNSQWGAYITYASPLTIEEFEQYLSSEGWEERSRGYYPNGYGADIKAVTYNSNATVYVFCKNNVRLSLIGVGNYVHESVKFNEVYLNLDNDTCVIPK